MSSTSKLVLILGTLLFGAVVFIQVAATWKALKLSDDVQEALRPIIEAQPKAFDLRDDPAPEAAEGRRPEAKPDPRLAPQPVQVTLFDESGRKLRKDRAELLLRPDAPVKGRLAYIDNRFDARDLLKEGEVLPQNDLLDLFARVRAARLAEAECADITASFAASCRVESYQVKRAEGTSYALAARLAFTQKAAPGPLPQTPGVLVVEERLRGDRVYYDPTEAGALSAARRALLSDVEAACDVVRSSLGSCHLTKVTLDQGAHGNRAYLRRSITMAATLPLDLGDSD